MSGCFFLKHGVRVVTSNSPYRLTQLNSLAACRHTRHARTIATVDADNQ